MTTDIYEQPTVDMTVHDPLLLRLGRCIVDHNPCYLLSGVCMLFGCFAINHFVHQQESGLVQLMMLIGVFNVYELLVIGLGLYFSRRGLVRDGAYLLALEALLVVDATLIYNECITKSLLWGGAVNAVVATAAMVKIAVILRGLGVRMANFGWVILGVDLAVLFALPGLLRELGGNEILTPLHMYGLWWLVGLLLAARAWVARWPADDSGMPVRLRPLARLRWAFAMLPWLSVVAHLATGHYLYDAPMHNAYLAPIVLGVAVLWSHYFEFQLTPRANRRVAATVGAIAISLSWVCPEVLMVKPGTWLPFEVTPLRLSLAAAVIWQVNLWWRLGGPFTLVTAIGYALVATTGATPVAIGNTLKTMLRAGETAVRWMVPTSLVQWGLYAVAVSFVFLGLGAWLSLLKRRRE